MVHAVKKRRKCTDAGVDRAPRKLQRDFRIPAKWEQIRLRWQQMTQHHQDSSAPRDSWGDGEDVMKRILDESHPPL